MKQLPISNSKEFAIVDDDVYEVAKLYKWCLSKGYVFNYKAKYLHNFVLRRTADHTMVAHHKNANTLDNRRENLEVVHTGLNVILCDEPDKGIFCVTPTSWRVTKTYRRKVVLLSRFETKEMAVAVAEEAKLYIEELYRIET